MEAIKIILLCIALAIIYGLIHDQITIRVCPEYFTVAHPPILPPETSLTVLALAWGVIATWWAGAIIGVTIAIGCRAGSQPKLSMLQVFPWLLRLMLCMAILAAITGIACWLLANRGMIHLQGWFAGNIPPPMHARFIADAGTHDMSYLSGLIGAIVLFILAKRARRHRGNQIVHQC